MKANVPKATRVRPTRTRGFGARLYRLDELIVRVGKEEKIELSARLFEKKHIGY